MMNHARCFLDRQKNAQNIKKIPKKKNNNFN
jgi:hypothetical protein